MVGKQLESLISNVKKGGTKKSFICYVDEKKERKFLVFKFDGIYQLDSKGEVKKLNMLTDIQDIFLSIENGDVKVIGSGNIGK
ncbi:hypothetical protein JSQ81_13985 [Sporosarcina sp. Marseille-Q4063]|uniref:hypothetical protein n=1 Tax=Sporosarcina sp. Marseille-Q4063 TaxID=2810514 RepID=UPI001BAEBB58|nr:hypothetical protein [Sporosarcina sp. Marseille-Q4063]QUW20920.1 hypothetical protein JSQ81_13985 [Sporosarcina sp. Marseille-Q4063]